MFGKKEIAHKIAHIREVKVSKETYISKATKIIGNIQTEESVVIEGSLVGDITITGSTSLIQVTEEGFIEGNIIGPNISIDGVVNGDIESSVTIECGSSARVLGNIIYSEIQLSLGAEVTGSLSRKTSSSVGGEKYQDFNGQNETSYE
jgi:cytoskeletal protein CcmA (bactofilin family)